MDIKTVEDLDTFLDDQCLHISIQNRQFTIKKYRRFDYVLVDSTGQETPYTDLNALLTQVVMMLVEHT